MKIVGQSGKHFVLSAYTRQDQVKIEDLAPAQFYLNTIKKRLETCLKNQILNCNISVDLDLHRIGIPNYYQNLYDNIPLLRKEIDNNIICYAGNEKELDHLVQNGVNTVRYTSFTTMSRIFPHIKSNYNKGEGCPINNRLTYTEDSTEDSSSKLIEGNILNKYSDNL